MLPEVPRNPFWTGRRSVRPLLKLMHPSPCV